MPGGFDQLKRPPDKDARRSPAVRSDPEQPMAAVQRHGLPAPGQVPQLQRMFGNQAVQRLILQRTVVIEDVPDEPAPPKNPDAEHFDPQLPNPATEPVLRNDNTMSYPARLPTLGAEQVARNQARLAARRQEDAQRAPALPPVIRAWETAPSEQGTRSYPAAAPTLSPAQVTQNQQRAATRRLEDAARQPQLGTLILGEAPGPALSEPQSDDQGARLAQPRAEVAAARADWTTWHTAITNAQAQLPKLATLLNVNQLNAPLAQLKSALDAFATADKSTTPESVALAIQHANTVKAARNHPALAEATAAEGALDRLQKFLAMPDAAKTALSQLNDALFRVVGRGSTAQAMALGGLAPNVLANLEGKTASEVLRLLDNPAAAGANAATCAADLAALKTQVDALKPFADAVAGGSGKATLQRFNTVLAAKKAEAEAALQPHLLRLGENAVNAWFMTTTEATRHHTDLQAPIATYTRMNANRTAVRTYLMQSPGASAHTNYWFLSEHLGKPGATMTEQRLAAFLVQLGNNVAGWVPVTQLTPIVDEAVYLFEGLQQGGITAEGAAMGKRGAGTLPTVAWKPAGADGRPSWMPHLGLLRGLAAGPRHAHATVRAERHTTDPGKLGAPGGVNQGSEQKNRDRAGGNTLTGANKGWEYTIPNFSGARLIEVPREGSGETWYVSLGHYATYTLVTDLP